MKRIGLLLLVFFILLGGYFFVRGYAQPGTFNPPEALLFTGWTADAFTELVLEDKENTVKMIKDDTSWMVDGHLVDQSRINLFLTTIGSMETVSRASTNPENHTRFRVGEDGVLFTAKLNDGSEESFIIGKSAGGNSMYIRQPESDEVYVIDRSASSLFTTDLLSWRVREIVSVAEQDIKSVQFKNRLDDYTLIKEADEYTLQRSGRAGVSVDAEKAGMWVNRLAQVASDGFLTKEEVEQKSSESPLATIMISKAFLVEGEPEEQILKVYTAEKEGFYYVLQDDSAGYLVNQTYFDNQFPRYTELLDELR